MSESTEEYLFGILQHEKRIDTLDLHLAIDQRPNPVVVAYGNGKLKLAHCVS
jgi:hypothetical protein